MRRDRGRGATRARQELRSKVSRARPEPDCVAWTARRFGSPSRRAIERNHWRRRDGPMSSEATAAETLLSPWASASRSARRVGQAMA